MRAACRLTYMLFATLPITTLFSAPSHAECERTEHIYQSVIDANPFIAALWEADPMKAENAILEFKTMNPAKDPNTKPTAEDSRTLERNPLLLKAFQENPAKTLTLLHTFTKALP